MDRIEIKKLNQIHKELSGKEVLVCGWIRSKRDTKTFGFIELNDGSFFKNLQVVYDDSLDNFSEITKLNIGSAIRVGMWWRPQAKQPYEVKATKR